MQQATRKKIKSFTDLITWQEGHKLVIAIYNTTKSFPADEKFGLTSQLRRAAVSVTSNIAEGFGRKSENEKLNFYSIAQGSVTEVQNQLLVARDVQYLNNETFQSLAADSIRTHKLLGGLMKSIRDRVE